MLPEFKIKLTRLDPDMEAYPCEDGFAKDGYEGQRSKLGGMPELLHGDEILPKCNECSESMIFVAQIDSIEHDWKLNPHAVDCLSDRQYWMFGDVGMIYVYFCKNCLRAQANFQSV